MPLNSCRGVCVCLCSRSSSPEGMREDLYFALHTSQRTVRLRDVPCWRFTWEQDMPTAAVSKAECVEPLLVLLVRDGTPRQHMPAAAVVLATTRAGHSDGFAAAAARLQTSCVCPVSTNIQGQPLVPL